MDQESTAYRIKDLERSQRPRERLEEQGAKALSNAELLAILLRVGTRGASAVQIGHRLLNRFQGLGGLQRAAFLDLCVIDGVGKAKAAQIQAAIELGRRLTLERPEDRITISSPQDAADQVMYEMAALSQEELWILLLDSRNHCLQIDHLYRGSLNASSVRPAEIFKAAIRQNAAALIVVHNHPSGDPDPSPEDVNLTRILVEAGELLELKVLDHIVIGAGRFVSIKSLHPSLWRI
jgi:DNA repair protein RadC